MGRAGKSEQRDLNSLRIDCIARGVLRQQPADDPEEHRQPDDYSRSTSWNWLSNWELPDAARGRDSFYGHHGLDLDVDRHRWPVAIIKLTRTGQFANSLIFRDHWITVMPATPTPSRSE
jgi:hypothetical protein